MNKGLLRAIVILANLISANSHGQERDQFIQLSPEVASYILASTHPADRDLVKMAISREESQRLSELDLEKAKLIIESIVERSQKTIPIISQ